MVLALFGLCAFYVGSVGSINIAKIKHYYDNERAHRLLADLLAPRDDKGRDATSLMSVNPLADLLAPRHDKGGVDPLHQFLWVVVIFENSAQVLFDTKANFGLWPMQQADRRADKAPVITDVAMTWYLSKVEKSSMDEAIPTDDTAKHLKLVANQLVKVDSNNAEDQKRSLWHRPADRLRWLRSAHAAFTRTPGAARATRTAFSLKELERALNYERIQALKAWWDVSK